MNPMRRVYLDHNATTPLDPEVLAAMLPYLSGEFGNPGSVHSFGQRARAAVERARESVAALIGARPSEIVFTSGGTESDNAAVFGVVSAAIPRGAVRPHVATTAVEHHAVLHACRALEARGADVTCLPVDRSGVVHPDDVRRALRPETVLISVMHANNETGAVQPVEAIGLIAREAGVTLHTDAVQSAGKVPVDVASLGVNLLSLSGHKIHGPQGVGALFVRRGTAVEPLLHGGPAERGRRAGTENVAGIVGLGKAAELARRDLAANRARVSALRDRLEQGLLARVPGARVNGAGALRTPNVSNLCFPDVDSESLVIALDLAGIACSAGAACSSGVVDPSHVLLAMGLSADEARASIRLSLAHTNTDEDIAYVLDVIPAAAARQREVSRPAVSARTERVPA
jgi:cysteine desulfurase